jgi:hypothetical protein
MFWEAKISLDIIKIFQHRYISTTTLLQRGDIVSVAHRKRQFGRNGIEYSEVSPTQAFRARVKYKLVELGHLAVITKGLAKHPGMRRAKLGDDDQELQL